MKKIIVLTALAATLFSVSAKDVTISKANTLTPLSKKIAITSTEDYTFTINAKGGKGILKVYLYQYSQAQRRLGVAHVSGRANTLTELVGPAICGAKEFIVKDASKWLKPRSGTNIVAFRAKADCSDLPNYSIDYYVQSVTKLDNGTWKVEMRTPLRRSTPSGTLVRQHYDGDHFSVSVPLPLKKPFTVTIKAAKGLGPNANTWWPGACFVQLSARTSDKTPVTITDWSLQKSSAK